MFKSIFALFKLLPKLFKSGKGAGLLNKITSLAKNSRVAKFLDRFKGPNKSLFRALAGVVKDKIKHFVSGVVSIAKDKASEHFSSTIHIFDKGRAYIATAKTKFEELKTLFSKVYKKTKPEVEEPKPSTLVSDSSSTKSDQEKISSILELAIVNHKRVAVIGSAINQISGSVGEQLTETSKVLVESILQESARNTNTISEVVSKNTDIVLSAITNSTKSTAETLSDLQKEMSKQQGSGISQESLDHLEKVNNQNTQRILEATQAANAEPTESEQDKTTTGIMQSLIETFIAVVGGVWILAAGLILPYIKPIAAIVGKVWSKIVEVAKYVGGIVQRIIHRVTWEVGRIGAGIKAVVPGTGYDWDDFNREGYNEYKGYPDDITPKTEVKEIKPKTMSVAEALTTEPDGHVQGLITESDPNIPKDGNEKPKVVKTESPKIDTKGGIGASADIKGTIEAKASINTVKESPKTGDNISTLAEVNETKTQKNVADESADKLAAKQAEGTDKLSQKLDQNAQKIEETSKTPPKTVIIDRETIKTVHSPIELDRGGIR